MQLVKLHLLNTLQTLTGPLWSPIKYFQSPGLEMQKLRCSNQHFQNACSFLDFTLFFLPNETTSNTEESCQNRWQHQKYKFGSWTPFSLIWALNYAMFLQVEAKAKESTLPLKQINHTGTLDNISPQKFKTPLISFEYKLWGYREYTLTILSQEQPHNQPCLIYTSLSATIANSDNESFT